MKMKNKFRSFVGILCATIVLIVTSCVDGFIDKEGFSSGVKNSTLSSPDSVTLTPSADESYITVSWPIVVGAGGYKVSLYNTTSGTSDDGTANLFVDGDTIQRPFDAESNYMAVIKTVGNTKDNNVATNDSTVGRYGQTVYATIPSGTDLYTYFQTNPVPKSTTTILYQLVPKGQYTMSGNVSCGLTPVKFRGDATNHPTVTMTVGSTGATTSFITDGSGLNFVRINFDCSALKGNGLVSFNPTINSAATQSAWGVIDNLPIAFTSCKITGLPVPLLCDGGQKYALVTFSISDCIIAQNLTSGNLFFGTIGSTVEGFIKDIMLTKSTFYNTATATSGYLITLTNSTYATKITGANWTSGSITLTNCTLWNMYSGVVGKRCMNYTGFSNLAANVYSLQKNIFLDCDDRTSAYTISNAVNRNGTPTAKYTSNTYWITGGTAATTTGSYPGCPLDEIYSSTYTYADSGNPIISDPQLKSTSTGDFTLQGPTQITYQTGDPRWWPNSTIWK